MRKATLTLCVLIAVLALVAAGAGVFWQAAGQPFAVQSLRGETVTIAGQGLYYYDSVSGAAQVRAGDVVTLVLGIPLLLVATALFARGSLRGRLLLSGTLGYFLYTYASLCFLAAYNPLFLLYVALFSLSLFAFVLSLMSVDVQALAGHFSASLPRRGIAALLFVVAGFLALAWVGRIVPALLQGEPPVGLENYTTLVIQALDLGVVAPTAVVAGVLLLRRQPWGYLLSSVMLIKGLTMGTAVSAMGLGMVLAGQAASPVELGVFPLITVFNAVMAVVLLRSVAEPGRRVATGQEARVVAGR
ncbi:MAG: hypothetical protein ACYC1C_01705 [Chloroflexota bacterium]